jgi:predicted nucleic acid-binding protein
VSAAIVDASVAAKFFLQEDGSDLARSLETGYELAAPDLIMAELCNLFWKRIRRGDMSVSDAQTALDRLPSGLELIQLERLASLAMEIAALLDHPAYDCFYLASAVRHSLPLITADNRLANLVSKGSFQVRVIRLEQLRN